MPVRCGHHVEQLLDGRVFVAHEQEQNVNTSLRFLGMCGHSVTRTVVGAAKIVVMTLKQSATLDVCMLNSARVCYCGLEEREKGERIGNGWKKGGMERRGGWCLG